jgi:DNA-binding response OmpR family regulator
MARILIVEDDADVATGLKNNLEIEGHEAEIVSDGQSAIERARKWAPALLVLDLMLPKVDGLRVLRTVRDTDPDVAILILTARGDETDKVRGLRLGADDYVTKPFGLLELLARVESLLRRRQPQASGTARDADILHFGTVAVHVRARKVVKGGVPVALRPKEFDLLVELLTRRGTVVSRLDLMKAVWGYSSAVITRTVDTHIGELRRKLEVNPAHPRHIVTVHSSGYRLDD